VGKLEELIQVNVGKFFDNFTGLTYPQKRQIWHFPQGWIIFLPKRGISQYRPNMEGFLGF